MNEPKLRFKADSETPFPDWEEKKIGELGTFTKGAPLSKADISDCGVPFILYGELYTTYNEVAYDIQRRTQSEADKKYYSHVGDVVIPTSGETAEEISTATCVMAQNVILAGDLNIYRSDIVDGRIMSYILNHQAKWKIATLAQGKSVVHIQAAQLSGVAVKYPPSTVEQQKIASLFTELDTLIQSAEKELEGYRELKQGMLQKMFPKKGELVPEIRFPEFSGEWKKYELGDVLNDMYNGQTPSRSKPNYWNGDVKWLSSGELNRQTVYDSIESITEEGRKSANLRIVPKGTFVMAITGLEAAGTRGNCALLGFNTTLNQSCMALFPNENLLTTKFLFQWYKNVGEEYGITYTQGTKQQSYNAQLLEILPISLPTIKEQNKITCLLEEIDNLIASQQQELDGYKELKKGLLQQMFC